MAWMQITFISLHGCRTCLREILPQCMKKFTVENILCIGLYISYHCRHGIFLSFEKHEIAHDLTHGNLTLTF